MPATARLSRKSYDWFGDDVPAHVVDQFNAALEAEGDAIRRELREEFRSGLAKLGLETQKREVDLLKFLFGIYWVSSIIALGAFSFVLSWIR